MTDRFPALSPDQREVLLAMPGQDRWADGDPLPYARAQARDCGLPVERWRSCARDLVAAGLATYGPLFSDDGAAAGSSYWRTIKGDQLAAQIEGGE